MINILIKWIENEVINIYHFVNIYLHHSLIDDIRVKKLNKSKIKESLKIE